MKTFLRLVAIGLCMTWLLSLFGCGKRHLVDGPGMERELWCAFTISRCTVQFEPEYSYTVKCEDASGEAYLYVGQTEENGVRLKEETVAALYNLDLLSWPEAETLTGTFLGLSVTDQKGKTHSKQISSAKEAEILGLLAPYLDGEEEEPFMLDGPSMEYTPPWIQFSLSRSDSNTRYSFWFTVTAGEVDTLVTGECQDQDGRSYVEESGIPISEETLQALRLMYLEQLPEEEPWPEDMEVPLDTDTIRLTVTHADGSVENKRASGELSMEIFELLLPYLQNN